MRVVIAHTLAQAKDALEVAAALNKSIILQSAPDAIAYAGARYLLEMFTQAHAEFPKAQATFILDCGEDAAQSIEAMRLGWRLVRSDARAEILAKLISIAGENGAEIVTAKYEALDLLGMGDTKGACKKWLEETL